MSLQPKSSTRLRKLPILLGAGREADLLLELMDWCGIQWKAARLYSDAQHHPMTSSSRHLKVYGDLEDGVRTALKERAPTLIALGSKHSALRHVIRDALDRAEVPLPNIVHASAMIAPSARLRAGITIFPNCVIGPKVRVGLGTRISCGVIIEHDTEIGENVWIGPGVVTSGLVAIGDHSFIGAGAVITREARVGRRALIGAGANVISDIQDGCIAYGNPASAKGQINAGMDAPTESAFTAARRRSLLRLFAK